MKNKKTVAMLSLLLMAFIYSKAQVDVFWGKENPLEKGGIPSILVKRGNNLLGTSRNLRGTKRSIVKYSFDGLQVQNEYQITGKASSGLKTIDKDYSFEQYIILRNKTFVAVSKYDKGSDLNSFFVQEITDEGKLTGSLKKLADISSKSKRNSGGFDVYESKDSNKILLVTNPPYEKYNKEKFGFKIFDENLKQLNNLEITLPYMDKYFSVDKYELSKDGNIYALVSIELPKKEKEKGEAGYYYEIIAIDPNGSGKVTEYEVKLPKKYITDISFRQEGKAIICAGFYDNIETKGISHDEINGIFYIRINKETKAIEANGLKDLDKKFIADLTSARKANKGRGISSSFELKNLFQKEDGGSILVSENSYDYQVTTCDGKGHCHTDHHYVRNNIIVINIDPNGSIKWYVNIPKFQHTINDGGMYSSYMVSTANKDNMLTAIKNKIYFVYNDNPINLDPTKVKTAEDIRPMKSVKKTTATLVTLSENGTFEKKAVFSNKENKIILLPDYFRKTGNGELIVPAINRGIYCCFIPFKKGKYKLARFEFK